MSDQTPLLGDSSETDGGIKSDAQRPEYGSDGERTNIPSSNVELPHKRPTYVYRLTFLAAIGGFLFGYDTGVVSGAMIIIRGEFDLNSFWQELVVRINSTKRDLSCDQYHKRFFSQLLFNKRKLKFTLLFFFYFVIVNTHTHTHTLMIRIHFKLCR